MYVNYTHVKCTFDSDLSVAVAIAAAVTVANAVGVSVSGIGKVVAGSFMVAIN